MITDFWAWNLINGLLLTLIATLAMAEVKSTSLIPKSLLLWPALVIVLGIVTLLQGLIFYGFSVFTLLGVVLTLCGLQATAANLRRTAPWPSGAVWLGLVLAGFGFQTYPLFFERVMGFIWMAIGITKVVRERSATLEGGTPIWILLLYVQAVLLASYR